MQPAKLVAVAALLLAAASSAAAQGSRPDICATNSGVYVPMQHRETFISLSPPLPLPQLVGQRGHL